MIPALLLLGCAPHRYPDGSGLEGQLEREVVALHQTVARLQASCGSPESSDAAYAELSGVFGGTEISVSREGRVTFVTLPASVLFVSPFDPKIRNEADGTLDLIATALTLHPELEVTLIGHTADRAIPSPESRRFPDLWALSYGYAIAVQSRLVTRFGVAPGRFTVAARASWSPIASNDVPAGQAENERVVLVLRPPDTAGR